MRAPSIKDRIELLKEHFSSGRFAKTQYLLQILAGEKLSAEQRILCASVGRRSGFPLQSIDLLRKKIYPSSKRQAQPGSGATPLELAEYASSASMVGAHSEARRIFARVPKDSFPEAIYLEANSELAVFDYDRATPLLEAFLKTNPPQDLRRGAEVRLAMCLIRGRIKDAGRSAQLLAPFLEGPSTDINLPERMYAGQMRIEHTYVFGNDTKLALEQALELERNHPEHNSVGLTLWSALLSIHHGRNVTAQRQKLKQERLRALQDQYWYGLRQFDLYESFLLKDRQALIRYHFGTPFPMMRRLAHERFDETADFADEYDWIPGNLGGTPPANPKSLPVFDTIQGVYEPTQAMLKHGDLLLTLLRALCTDFISPLSEHEIHERLYPGEPHLGEASSQRIHTVIHRLRHWLERESIPIQIEAFNRAYRISPESKIRLRVLNPDHTLEGIQVLPPELRETETFIRKAFSPSARFSSTELTKLQKTSPRTAVYRLKGLVEAGILLSEGAGPARRYRLRG